MKNKSLRDLDQADYVYVDHLKDLLKELEEYKRLRMKRMVNKLGYALVGLVILALFFLPEVLHFFFG